VLEAAWSNYEHERAEIIATKKATEEAEREAKKQREKRRR
jgi:hypothetical protein